ncbi:MFS transporter [Algoriphagus lutimaris]|uniref:MFS transporter n=1 Tax=Algoriphagus lutimaris TaxID=613197 RepID=UPI00196A7BA8|nr:MFS transporter [Algoriphagus lutimaris]MBN3519361.1 MFS transporter [Algoriphagus lutimaris]
MNYFMGAILTFAFPILDWTFCPMNNSIKIYLLSFICFIAGTSEFVIVGVLDKIAESIQISVSAAGQLITVFAITAAIGTPIAIYKMRTLDQRKVLIISLITFSIGSFMMVIAPNYYLLLVARVIMALGMGVFNVMCFIVAAKLAPLNKRASAIATVTVGYNAALIVGLPIGRIVTNAFGWQAIFWGTSISAILFFFILAKFIPSFSPDGAVPFRKQIGLLRKPNILLSLGMSFFWILGYAILYTYITPFLNENSLIHEELLSVAFLGFGIATLIGNKSGGFLGDKFGVPQTILVSMVCNLTLLISLSLFIGITAYLTIAILMLWAISAWLPGPLFRFSIMSLSDESPGVILSLYNSIIQFGFALGAGLGGIEINRFTTLYLGWTAAGLVFISLILTFTYHQKSKAIA